MSLLNKVTTGPSRTGVRIVIAGQEKMGKTTTACQAPLPLLIPLEVGFANVTVAKTPMVTDFTAFKTLLADIKAMSQHYLTSNQPLPFRSLVFDSVTALERLIHEDVMKRDPSYRADSKRMTTMESAHGGYGRAYSMANTDFNEVLQLLDELAVTYGLNIIFTAHVFAAKLIDPSAGQFDSWDILLHSPKNEKVYGKRELLTQWADVVGFIYEPIVVSAADGVSKGASLNKGRVIGLSRTPAYVAGNRFGVTGEIQLPPPPNLAWNCIAKSIYDATQGGTDLYTR